MSAPARLPADLWTRAAATLIEAEPDADRRQDLHELFTHRAAVAEHDGGLTTEAAEKLAFHELRAELGRVAAPEPTPLPVRSQDEYDAADHAVLETIFGGREVWTPRTVRHVPGVPDGWLPERWVGRLRQLADTCQDNRPDLAARHRTEAERVERAVQA